MILCQPNVCFTGCSTPKAWRRIARARCRTAAAARARGWSGILEGFPADDLDHMAVDGDIVMTCEFCNYDFRFPREDVHGRSAAS